MASVEERKQADFARIRGIIIRRLLHEYDAEESFSRREWIKAMAKSVALTPVEVFPQRSVLQEGVERSGKFFSFFQVKGQSLIEFMELVIGNKKRFVVSHKIQLGEFWRNGKPIPESLMTLLHELGHNAELYHPNKMAISEAEKERLADTLAVFTAKKLGFPSKVIARSLEGRQSIIGREYHEKLLAEALSVERPRARRLLRGARRKGLARVPVRTVRLRSPQRNSLQRGGKKIPTFGIFPAALKPNSFGRQRRRMAA